MSVWKWSETPGENDDADDTINWRESQSPSSVNNSARAVMTAIKKWWLDLGGMIDTAGTSTAYTLTSRQSITTLTDGASVSARMHATNGASPTLAVDGTAAKAITVSPGVAPDAGMFILGTVQRFTYDAGSDEWRAVGNFIPAGVAKTGDLKMKVTSVTDAGWVLASGRTIGNASSGATERANADTEALFLQLWADYSNTLLAIEDSSGSVSTRGASAAADYAANKRLPLPSMRDRFPIGKADMGGVDAALVADDDTTILGNPFGAEKRTIAQANLPAVNLVSSSLSITNGGSVTRSLVTEGKQVGTGAAFLAVSSFSNNTLSIAGTVPLGGSGTQLSTMPPARVVFYFIKL